nr:glycosyltransferase [Conexibacter arvalis]
MGAARVEVIENYVRDEAAASGSKRPADGRVVVGWVAGKEHHLDVERLPIRAALAELLERRPEVEIVTVGVGLGLRSDRYRHIPAVRFFDLPAVTREFDLGLAPIADIPLNRSRSNVKLKEYAAAGVPWLASPIGAYAALGKREGGRLVADDDWPRALDELIDRKRDRRKLAGRAFKWGSGETVSANVGRWERLLGDVVGLARPESDSVRRRISPRLR